MRVGSRLGLMAAGMIVVVAMVGATCTISISKLVSAHKSATHTREIIQKLDYLMFRVMESTSAQRAYLITQQRTEYEAYKRALEEAHQAIESLRLLVAESPRQLDRVDRLGAALKERWELLAASVEATRTRGREAGLDDMRATDWQRVRKEWTQVAQEIRSEEDHQLQQRDDQVEDGTFIAHMTVLCGTIFAAVFVGLSNFLFGHHISSCVRKLLKASDNIEKGRFDTIVAITSTDEFGELADAYTSLGQKLLFVSEEFGRSRRHEERLGAQLDVAKSHLSQLSQTVEEDSAALLEQTAMKTDELGEHSQMLIDGLKASATEVLHRVSAVQEKLEFSSRSTVELCREIEQLHDIQALLEDLSTQLEVISVATTMEISRSSSPDPSLVALGERFKGICQVVRKEKVDVQKLIGRIQILSSKALLSTQDASASVATTRLSSSMLLESLRGFPNMENASNELVDDLIASIRSQATKLLQGKDRMREMIREIDRQQLELHKDHSAQLAIVSRVAAEG